MIDAKGLPFGGRLLGGQVHHPTKTTPGELCCGSEICHDEHDKCQEDTVIVLSNGEIFQPSLIQDLLSRHPAIRETLIVGNGKPQLGAILELRNHPQSEHGFHELQNEIWHTIEKVNRLIPAHGRLLTQFVTLTSPNKPFIRDEQGNVSRAATLQLYADKVEELFARGKSSLAIDIDPLDIDSIEALQYSLLLACEKVLNLKICSVDDDFFATGADSLSAMRLAATLKRALSVTSPEQADEITTRFIYSHPTIRLLSLAMMKLAHNPHDEALCIEPDTDDVEDLVDRVVRDISLFESQACARNANATAVLLTGSTGSLGSYILDQLLSDQTISRIYCLNRAEDGQSKQTYVNDTRGLSTIFDNTIFLHCDLSQELLGLDSKTYQNLANEVKLIIHSQWPTNFNLHLFSFESHIKGVAHLCSFSSYAPSNPSICFLSSIASVENWTDLNSNSTHISTHVPEQPHPNPHLASSGYGQSKVASSIILDRAAHHGVRSMTIRIGQIAGPSVRGTKGLWPKCEWLPSLIASSRYLGVVPGMLEGAECVDWIAVDRVAGIVSQLAMAFSDEEGCGGGSAYTHVVSPVATTWKETFLPEVLEYFGGDVQVVSLAEWVERLKESALVMRPGDLEFNPAVKLVAFFKGLVAGIRLPRLDTHRAQEMSLAMRECTSVSRADVERWLDAWDF